MKEWGPRLALRKRLKVIRKWSISYISYFGDNPTIGGGDGGGGGGRNTPSRFILQNPGGPRGPYADSTSTSELLFASFLERMLVQNISHENYWI